MSATLDGTTICGIKMDEKHVVMVFPKDISFAKFDPETAQQVAEEMLRCAYLAIHGKPAEKNKSLAAQQIQQKLVTRLTIVLRDLNARDKPYEYQAQAALDIVLSEMKGE